MSYQVAVLPRSLQLKIIENGVLCRVEIFLVYIYTQPVEKEINDKKTIYFLYFIVSPVSGHR